MRDFYLEFANMLTQNPDDKNNLEDYANRYLTAVKRINQFWKDESPIYKAFGYVDNLTKDKRGNIYWNRQDYLNSILDEANKNKITNARRLKALLKIVLQHAAKFISSYNKFKESEQKVKFWEIFKKLKRVKIALEYIRANSAIKQYERLLKMSDEKLGDMIVGENYVKGITKILDAPPVLTGIGVIII